MDKVTELTACWLRPSVSTLCHRCHLLHHLGVTEFSINTKTLTEYAEKSTVVTHIFFFLIHFVVTLFDKLCFFLVYHGS